MSPSFPDVRWLGMSLETSRMNVAKSSLWDMPELAEVEIVARRLTPALSGAVVESALAPGMNVMKTFEPPLEALAGREVTGVRRVGKMPVVEFGDLALLVHLMSAGRLKAFDKRASPKDRASRVLVRLEDGRELRLREFGTKQRAWAKLLPADAVAEDEMVATLGPEAWPPPPLEDFAAAIDQPRHLHPLLRDQRDDRRHRPLLGRRDPLGGAALALQEGSELDEEEVERLHAALHVLGDAIDHYEETIGEQVPDKVPMPLQVHRREGEPCPAAGPRSRPSSSPSTRPTTAPRSRPAAACSRTGGSPNCSSGDGKDSGESG